VPDASSSATTTAGSVSLPSQLIGLAKDTSAQGEQDVSYLDKEYLSPIAKLLVDDKSAIYGKEPFFFITAGKLPAQATSPDAVAKGIQATWSGTGITNVRVFPAGSVARVICGQLQNKDDECAWVDSMSFGYVLYPPGFASSLDVAASETGQIHSAVVH
jgi:hypothetical protein